MQTEPASQARGDLPALWQFRMSHYNEKARWAFDYKRVAHVRRTLIPGWHVVRLMMMSRQKQVPVAVVDGQVIAGSDRIIEMLEREHPDPPLFPAESQSRARAIELARFFDTELGPYVRRALFYEVLPDSAYSTALFAHGASFPVRALYRAGFPAVRVIMRLDMKISDATAREAIDRTLIELERLDNLIPSSGYLVGEAFSVADLTAAALLSPIVQPPQFPYAFPPPTPALARLRERLGHQRVREWVLGIYAKHRGSSAEVA
jgi:glutathione S-transferase